MLTGCRAFEGEEVSDALAAILRGLRHRKRLDRVGRSGQAMRAAVPTNRTGSSGPAWNTAGTDRRATRLASGAGISLSGWESRALYAVARDGRFLMNINLDAAAGANVPPLTIVLNWDAALKK